MKMTTTPAVQFACLAALVLLSLPSLANGFTALDELQTTLTSVFSSSGGVNADIHQLCNNQREAFGVASNIQRRLDAMQRSGDCRRCYLQRKWCVCEDCPPLEDAYDANKSILQSAKVNRLFLLTHHKEIGMVVDTCKLISSSFPFTSRLVVGGIGSDHQQSMEELCEAMTSDRCLVLFPSEDAKPFVEIKQECMMSPSNEEEDSWDIIVIDGTWQQARKLYNRYIPEFANGGPRRVCLSDAAVSALDEGKENDNHLGYQLRRHPIKWREISTLEATRLLLQDVLSLANIDSDIPKTLAEYQVTADNAARKQLGPPRISQAVLD